MYSQLGLQYVRMVIRITSTQRATVVPGTKFVFVWPHWRPWRFDAILDGGKVLLEVLRRAAVVECAICEDGYLDQRFRTRLRRSKARVGMIRAG